MYNSIFDRGAKRRLEDVLKHEGSSMAALGQRLGMSEGQILVGVRAGCHRTTGSIGRAFGKSMIQRHLLEPGRYAYDKSGELRAVT